METFMESSGIAHMATDFRDGFEKILAEVATIQ